MKDDKPRAVQKTDAEWRAQLNATQYEVARQAGTERAFTGKYWDHWEAGHYNCIGCGTPLFEASTKFDAGCGWPSYSEPINSTVVERLVDRSHGMTRIEVAATNAVRTWAMCSTTGRHPLASAFASIRLR